MIISLLMGITIKNYLSSYIKILITRMCVWVWVWDMKSI